MYDTDNRNILNPLNWFCLPFLTACCLSLLSTESYHCFQNIDEEEEEGDEEDEKLSGDEALDFLSADFGMEEGEESDEEEGMSSKAMKHMALQHSEEVCPTPVISILPCAAALHCHYSMPLSPSAIATTVTILCSCTITSIDMT